MTNKLYLPTQAHWPTAQTALGLPPHPPVLNGHGQYNSTPSLINSDICAKNVPIFRHVMNENKHNPVHFTWEGLKFGIGMGGRGQRYGEVSRRERRNKNYTTPLKKIISSRGGLRRKHK